MTKIKSLMDLKRLSLTDARYAKLAADVSVDLGGPDQPLAECLQYLTIVALEVSEVAVMEEVYHTIKLTGFDKKPR